jgi:hypothetical protein
MLVEKQDKRVPETRWCLAGLTNTQWRRLQKLHKNELENEKADKARDD